MNEMNRSLEMVKIAVIAMEDKKAEDIKVIDIHEISALGDYFVIGSGNNRNQVQTICDNVDEALGRKGFLRKENEGYENANWILMDYGDIVIHIFDKENRIFYDLERIWRDGKNVAIDELCNQD